MRRLSDRARLEGMLALRKALETVRRPQASAPPAIAAVPPLPADELLEDTKWWQRAEETTPVQRMLAALPDAPLGAPGIGLSDALDRIADSIERIAAQLDSYHAERGQHLDAIEFLLREMLIGTVQPTAASSVVRGGVVEPVGIDGDDIMIIPDGGPLEVNTSVEVRSRFHDRWISGFAIAEAVDAPGRLRYRLTRRSDGIPLPILFDASDVRAAAADDRQPASAMPPTRGTRSRA
jgi:hypothetical protein